MLATIVQAVDRTVGSAAQQPFTNPSGGELPVHAYRCPHDTREAKLLLSFANAEPPNAIWRPEPSRPHEGVSHDGILRPMNFHFDESGLTQPERRMRIGVIPQIMSGLSDLDRQIRQAPDVHSALKKSGFDIEPVQDVEQFSSPGTGSVIEGKSNRGAP